MRFWIFILHLYSCWLIHVIILHYDIIYYWLLEYFYFLDNGDQIDIFSPCDFQPLKITIQPAIVNGVLKQKSNALFVLNRNWSR